MNEIKPPVFTIAEFCADHRISRTTLHYLERDGKAPRMMTVGRRVYITAEAAAEWRKRMEGDTAAALEAHMPQPVPQPKPKPPPPPPKSTKRKARAAEAAA